MKRDFRASKLDRRSQAEELAIQALSFIAEEPERLGRFLALSGLGPGSLRAAARQPHFLTGVLDHVLGDEKLLLAFAQHVTIDPDEVKRAQHALAGGAWERDVP
jgi:hypothetical protein